MGIVCATAYHRTLSDDIEFFQCHVTFRRILPVITIPNEPKKEEKKTEIHAPSTSITDSPTYEIRMNLDTKWLRGIQAYSEGLRQAISIYRGTNCTFSTNNHDVGRMARNRVPNRFFFTISPSAVCRVLRMLSRSPMSARHTIFGPLPVPLNWSAFPIQNNCMESDFKKTLKMMGSYAVHSKRVESYLTKRSGIEKYPAYKFAKVRACTMLQPEKVKPWGERNYDVIFFEKYADEDHSKQGAELYEELSKAGLKITRLSYSGEYQYTHDHMKEVANDSRFIVYFSFWDTGAIGLLEIQNYGVYSFTVQDDLIDETHETGMYVENLIGDDMKASAEVILQKMKEINDSKPSAENFAQINQNRNSCVRALDDICDHVAKMPTMNDPPESMIW